MKRFELVKREDHYGLYNEDGHKIAATIDGCNSKLSKENCDEIFKVVDVGALALEECNNTDPLRLDSVKYKQDPYFRIGYLKGYNKAMELNNKLFTVEDIRKAIAFGWDYEGLTKEEMLERYNFKLEYDNSYAEDTDKFIQSLQQPKEIEVEIRCYVGNGDKESDSFNDPLVTNTGIPKLDENGCLILNKL